MTGRQWLIPKSLLWARRDTHPSSSEPIICLPYFDPVLASQRVAAASQGPQNLCRYGNCNGCVCHNYSFLSSTSQKAVGLCGARSGRLKRVPVGDICLRVGWTVGMAVVKNPILEGALNWGNLLGTKSRRYSSQSRAWSSVGLVSVRCIKLPDPFLSVNLIFAVVLQCWHLTCLHSWLFLMFLCIASLSSDSQEYRLLYCYYLFIIWTFNRCDMNIVNVSLGLVQN